jgi:hypothetical protein
VLLTAVLVLTFFPWVGCYAGDSAVYAQRPWGALFGSTPTRNFKFAGTVPGGWVDGMHSDWKVLLPCFLLLLVALAFAWAERWFHVFPRRLPPPLTKVWPWRNAIVAGCAALVLLLLVIQWANGFGMERAIRQQVADKFAKEREQAAGSREAQDNLKYAEEQELDRYDLEHTTWMYLALACAALAVGAILLRDRLEIRGNKPPPKILLHY